MYLSSYKLRPGDTTLLRVALAMLHAHDAAYRQAYGERRTAFPEYARLQAHTIHVQELLLLVQPEARPRVESNTAEEARYENGRRLVRTGAIVAGVGLGLLLLGFGLLFGGGLILGGAIIATIAGITLLVGIIVMVVGAVQKA
ncbi:hypothetical protein [Nannocystis sp.]|uniref:hypothetical protein n=1 Tax=Nannocystis sp. TaxID=1962667 RepID=UPI0025D4966B|nr:hypothetical protein [Nannocystis sp.]